MVEPQPNKTNTQEDFTNYFSWSGIQGTLELVVPDGREHWEGVQTWWDTSPSPNHKALTVIFYGQAKGVS